MIYEKKKPVVITDQKFSEGWVADVTNWLNKYNRVRDAKGLDPVVNDGTKNKILWNEICSKWDPTKGKSTVDQVKAAMKKDGSQFDTLLVNPYFANPAPIRGNILSARYATDRTWKLDTQ